MKRMISFLITVLLLATLCGCSAGGDSETNSPNIPEADKPLDTVVTVGNDDLRAALLRLAGKADGEDLLYGDFQYLSALYLSQITDGIEDLAQFYLPRLTSVGLTYCGLTEIPAFLVALPNLRIIDLSHNEIETLPALVALGHLTRVDLSHNKLTGLSGLPVGKVEWVNLSHNDIASIPENVQEYKRLLYLDISDNRLTALPNGFLQMSALVTLNVKGNPLASLPDGIEQAIPDFLADPILA